MCFAASCVSSIYNEVGLTGECVCCISIIEKSSPGVGNATRVRKDVYCKTVVLNSMKDAD